MSKRQSRDVDLNTHECVRDESWREYDAQHIYLCRVCDICRDSKLAQYRPEILTGYSQADVDEPIDSDDGEADYEARFYAESE